MLRSLREGMSDVTHLLDAIQQGDPRAAEELLPLVYAELRKLAAVRMANESSGHTLQPTALVHEAWLRLTSNNNAALVDWNNNYADDDNKCVIFHCGNWAKSFLPDIKISTAPIIGTAVGVENTYGALDGRTPAGPLTYGRITTADAEGKIRCYVGEGELTNDPLDTFGNRAVAHVPNLQNVLRHVCQQGFEHHVVMTVSKSADILAEAFGNYFGWEVKRH